MKKKILVIEDDDDICQIISYVLIDGGFVTILCKTDHDIFDIIIINPPDIILLDVVRITEQGTELCKAIKAAESSRHIPVIVLSTHTKIDAVKEICADDVIAKPFDISLLLAVVKEQMLHD